jgi:hypothetical protein
MTKRWDVVVKINKYKHNQVVIGGNLSALIYSYLNNVPCIINKLSPPHQFEKINNQTQLELWNKLYFLLSLAGLNLFGDQVQYTRINENEVVVATLNSKVVKINFKKATVFDDENITGLPISIEELYKTTNKFIVLDWMTARSCMVHDFEYLQTENDFVKDVYFYPTERVAGNHLNQRDLVAVSHLTTEQLQNFDYSDTYARFKVLKLLKKKGFKGRKNGFLNEKRVYYSLDLKVEKREIKKFRMNLYDDTDKIEFNYSSPQELLTQESVDGYQNKLNHLLNAL